MSDDTRQVDFTARAEAAADLTVERPINVTLTALAGWVNEGTARGIAKRLRILADGLDTLAGDVDEERAKARIRALMVRHRGEA